MGLGGGGEHFFWPLAPQVERTVFGGGGRGEGGGGGRGGGGLGDGGLGEGAGLGGGGEGEGGLGLGGSGEGGGLGGGRFGGLGGGGGGGGGEGGGVGGLGGLLAGAATMFCVFSGRIRPLQAAATCGQAWREGCWLAALLTHKRPSIRPPQTLIHPSTTRPAPPNRPTRRSPVHGAGPRLRHLHPDVSRLSPVAPAPLGTGSRERGAAVGGGRAGRGWVL